MIAAKLSSRAWTNSSPISRNMARGKTAAYYQRRGYLTGAGTLVDDLIRRAGLINLATTLHKPALSHLSLEELVAHPPDYLIVESNAAQAVDQGTEMLDHPVLKVTFRAL